MSNRRRYSDLDQVYEMDSMDDDQKYHHSNESWSCLPVGMIWTGIKNSCSEITRSVKNGWKSCVGGSSNHIGQIIDVRPISDHVPVIYRGKCYHTIKMADGSQFELKFSEVDYSEVEPHLVPGRMVRILYKMPGYRVLNVYPQKMYQTMDFESFMDDFSDQIMPDTQIRVCWLNNQIQKVEFLERGLISSGSDSDNDDQIVLVA